MICFPNAKINLGLNIVSKREDGYHNLETVFYPIGIKDALEIIVSKDKKDSFIESGIKLDSLPENNLVLKALRLLRQNHNIPPIEITLLKKIPFGAGIGGGSADASFMLKLLNQTFSLNLTNDYLLSLAAQLGADCPFFIHNSPMYATGIGDKLESIPLSLNDYFLVLVKPNIHIPTKAAFAHIKPEYPSVSLRDIIQLPISEWKHLMCNDFEKSIFTSYPIVGEVKQKLYDLGAVYASMSGSGASVYGIFNSPIDLKSYFPNFYVWEETK